MAKGLEWTAVDAEGSLKGVRDVCGDGPNPEEDGWRVAAVTEHPWVTADGRALAFSTLIEGGAEENGLGGG